MQCPDQPAVRRIVSTGTLATAAALADADLILYELTVPYNRRDRQRRTQTPSKSLKKTAFEAKGRLYTTGKVIQRLFIIDLLPPQGFRPEGEILRRHSSNSRVY